MGAILQKLRKRKSKHGSKIQKSASTPNLYEQQQPVTNRHSRSGRFFSVSVQDVRMVSRTMEIDNEEVNETNLTDVAISTFNHDNIQAGSKRLFIAAIDIGTAYSGYAFSARREVEKDPSKIYCPYWQDDDGQYYKTATAVLFDKRGNFSAFGFDAEKNYYFEREDQGDRLKCFFFNDFKMLLYEKRDNLSADFVMKDIVGKQMKAIKVFSSAIEYLKNHLLNSLQTRFKRGGNISNADIHWVLTVPAIWEMKAKQFMRDAAEMAGIKGDQLSLALEPEAASLYCQKVPMSIREHVTKTVDFLGPGTSYVVLDQGGGTFDVTGHQIEDDNFLKELFSPNGGSWGGNNVNHEFEKYLEEIFTVSVVDAVKQENPMAYFDAVKEFEKKKKSFNLKTESDIFLLICPVFKDMYEKINKSHLPSEIQINYGKIRIPAQRFKTFFQQTIQSITGHLSQIFNNPDLRNINIILAVGGFSESEILIDSIRERFPNMDTIVPKDPGLAVLKGAVLFGLDPLAIKSRISRYTYGIKVEKEISTTEDVNYRTLRRDRQGRRFATDVFEKLVEIGEEIKVGEWQPAKEYDPIYKRDREVQIEFYASEEKDPVHVTDPGCIKLGTLNVDLRERVTTDGALKLQVNAGGTEILAVITDENTGRKFNAKLCLP